MIVMSTTCYKDHLLAISGLKIVNTLFALIEIYICYLFIIQVQVNTCMHVDIYFGNQYNLYI